MITMIPVLAVTHLNLEMVCGGPLPAAQLGSQLQAVGEQIVEVLHPTLHNVPLGTIRDTT